ncbi:MAG: zinc-binding dehydrogenase [Ectothiorhodospiraceae bacterium]|nr:zinc-binding dehydrogenase [Chromatiales bacterium]MCP5155527.1 zinc-binding dehydrogenase [Ectothiorhodospiraceae bacterium]
MHAAVFRQHGSTDNIRWEAFPDPECGESDVVLRMHAAALNGFEPMIVFKTTALKTPLPMIVGGDGAGEVVATGSAVTGVSVGDRVSIYPMVPGEGMTGETRLGTCAELHRVPAANVIPIPDGLDYQAAASLPIAYGTALRMMHTRGRVKAGEKVLVLGAAGGVGTACVQLAKAAGAEVIACSSSAWKLERLRELGADHVVDTSTTDFRQWVWDNCGKPRMGQGGGVDMVVNYIGGDTWVDSLKVISPGGRMLVCGATAGYETANDCRYIWTYEISIVGSNGWTREDQAEMLRMAADGRIRPVIHDVRPMRETGAAVQVLADRDFFGKLVLVP